MNLIDRTRAMFEASDLAADLRAERAERRAHATQGVQMTTEITDDQIVQLRAEAVMAGDLEQVALCDAALNDSASTPLAAAEAIKAHPTWGPRVTDSVWGATSDPVWTPALRADARAECEAAIARARAQG